MNRAALWHPLSCRLHIVLLLSFSYFCSSLILVNFGLNLTCMVEDHPSNKTTSSKCTREISNSSHHSYGGTLQWTRKQEDLLLSATSWGSLVAQLPAMFIARQFRAKTVLFWVMFTHALFNVFIPLFAVHIGFDSVFALRVLIGISHSFVDVSIYTLIDKWFPRFERSTALAIFAVGGQVSGIIGGPITGLICGSSLGWQFNYYLTSAFGFIFCGLWLIFSAESPKSCRRIGKEEYSFLEEHVHVKEKTEGPIPFRYILLSIPVWAQFQMQLSAAVAQNISQSFMPQFFKEAVMIGVVMNGYFVAIPNLCSFIVRLVWSTGVDFLKKRGFLGPTPSVKLSQAISSTGVVTFYLVLAFFVGCNDPALALISSTMISSSQALESAGHITSLLSLAPQHTEALSAMSMFFAQTGRLITPYIVGALRKNETNGWEHVFLLGASLNCFSGIIFVIFSSGVEQSWNSVEQELTRL